MPLVVSTTRYSACFQQFTNMLYRRVELQGKEKAASDAESDGIAAASTPAAPPPAASRSDVLPRTIYALGMGSVSSNRTAQIQLAFLLELQDHFKTEIQRSTGHRHPPSTATSEESTASRAEALAVSDLVDIHSYDPLSSLADNDWESDHLLRDFRNGRVQGCCKLWPFQALYQYVMIIELANEEF